MTTLSALLLLATIVSAEPSATSTPASTIPAGDVVVYGATLSGCIAAVAASRSGAKQVVLAFPYLHVGGMTTGGLQHADPGNETTVAGITGEFFQRVMAHYPPAPAPSPPTPPPHSAKYACRAGRCVGVVDGKGGPTSDPQCLKSCPQLAADEWLAVRRLSSLSNGNRTLTVSLPAAGQGTTFIKKSEKLAKDLPTSSTHAVKQGQVLALAAPAVVADDTYLLLKLSPSPLRRLIDATTNELWPAAAGGAAAAAAGAPPPLRPGAPPGWLYEGHVAEAVLEEMLAEANVTVVRGLGGLVSAVLETTEDGTRGRSGGAGAAQPPRRLVSVTAETGAVLRGRVWIDASYAGDLAYVAGAEMVWGRESAEQYNESGAGRQPQSLEYEVDPFWPDGSVIPHVSNAALAPVGGADKRIEVYTFRLCITDSPGHQIPIWKPKGYNASEWEFWRRLYAHNPPKDLKAAGLNCLGPIPNNYSDCPPGPSGRSGCVKCDMLGMKHGTDMLNGAWDYPNATTEVRRAIRAAHIAYITGLLWFWATDPSVDASLHAEMAAVGHCTDEYVYVYVWVWV